MKRNIILLTTLFIYSFGFAQKIHSPAEIFKIMNESKVSYEIQMLDKTIDCPDYSKKLNFNNSYRVYKDSSILTLAFEPNEIAKPYFEKAEKSFQSQNFDEALENYQLALAADSTLSMVITYVGQIYEHKNDYLNAIKWYKKAIGRNYIDYMAHWFLADAYANQNDIASALDEIVIASILNRNNPRIQQSMKNILAKAKRDNADWYFNPQIEITQLAPARVKVAINEKWTGYGIAKALWQYEPGYKESMGITKDKFSIIEDRECLLALIISLDNSKVKMQNEPQLKILKEALENKFLDQYIIYEVWLPQNPFIAFQLPESTILEIKDYILKIRNK